MEKIRLYLVSCYQAYRADEVGKRWFINKPKDTLYYKHEIIDEAEFILPKGYEICESFGDKVIYHYDMLCDLFTTNDGDVMLVDNIGGNFIFKA